MAQQSKKYVIDKSYIDYGEWCANWKSIDYQVGVNWLTGYEYELHHIAKAELSFWFQIYKVFLLKLSLLLLP